MSWTPLSYNRRHPVSGAAAEGAASLTGARRETGMTGVTDYPLGVTVACAVCMAAWTALACLDIARQRRLEPAGSDPDALGRSSGLAGITRLRLGAARFLYFAYGVFFVAYHLCYENVKNHTDGMEYLSDWTFILLGMVFGLLAMFSLQPATAEAPQLVELTTAMHGVCWSSNIVSTAGAWYSFFFFPVCKSLEGVDNYPWCYLEWYRITEHALNMVFLFGDCFAGAVPVRRKDLGWSVIFLQCYAVYTWHRMFTTGKCAYIMFDFSTGWASIAWTNAAFVGIALAHVVTERLFALRDRRRQGGVGNVGRVGSDGSLPSHARYDALSNSD